MTELYYELRVKVFAPIYFCCNAQTKQYSTKIYLLNGKKIVFILFIKSKYFFIILNMKLLMTVGTLYLNETKRKTKQKSLKQNQFKYQIRNVNN